MMQIARIKEERTAHSVLHFGWNMVMCPTEYGIRLHSCLDDPSCYAYRCADEAGIPWAGRDLGGAFEFPSKHPKDIQKREAEEKARLQSTPSAKP
jgi:hypothetical protein